MADYIIYHNPRCSKSRQTLELLEQQGISPQIIRYLETPPDIAQLSDLLSKLGMQARELVRNKEAVYRELKLDSPTISDTELLAAMVAEPKLIERPIVVKGDRAVLGRPPENVLELIG